jgi:hypothetical protein
MSTEGSDVDGGTPLSHLSHEPMEKITEKVNSSAAPYSYSMGAMDFNAKLRNFNML